jgi:hypothetical protein
MRLTIVASRWPSPNSRAQSDRRELRKRLDAAQPDSTQQSPGNHRHLVARTLDTHGHDPPQPTTLRRGPSDHATYTKFRTVPADADGVAIAYAVRGSGPIDVVFVPAVQVGVSALRRITGDQEPPQSSIVTTSAVTQRSVLALERAVE